MKNSNKPRNSGRNSKRYKNTESNAYKIKGITLSLTKSNDLFLGRVVHNSSNGGGLKGDLDDIWGGSMLEGTLNFSKGELSFARSYGHFSKGLIFYTLERQDNNLWVGGYSGELVGIGGIQCEIYAERASIDWNMRRITERVNPFDLGKIVNKIAQNMTANGFFNKYNDDFGKEKFVLTEKAIKLALLKD